MLAGLPPVKGRAELASHLVLSVECISRAVSSTASSSRSKAPHKSDEPLCLLGPRCFGPGLFIPHRPPQSCHFVRANVFSCICERSQPVVHALKLSFTMKMAQQHEVFRQTRRSQSGPSHESPCPKPPPCATVAALSCTRHEAAAGLEWCNEPAEMHFCLKTSAGNTTISRT